MSDNKKTPQSPMGIPVPNPDPAVRGAYTYLGILIGRLYNLGETSHDILAIVRLAMNHAKDDGVGQEG